MLHIGAWMWRTVLFPPFSVTPQITWPPGGARITWQDKVKAWLEGLAGGGANTFFCVFIFDDFQFFKNLHLCVFCNFLCLVFFPLGLRCAPVPRVQHLSAGVVDATNQAANHTLQLLQQEQSAKLDAYEAAALSEMEGVAAEKIATQGWVGFESSASFMPMKVAHPAPGVAGLHVCV